jgi:hypothetical protein
MGTRALILSWGPRSDPVGSTNPENFLSNDTRELSLSTYTVARGSGDTRRERSGHACGYSFGDTNYRRQAK